MKEGDEVGSDSSETEAGLKLLWPRPQRVTRHDGQAFSLPDSLPVFVAPSLQKGSGAFFDTIISPI